MRPEKKKKKKKVSLALSFGLVGNLAWLVSNCWMFGPCGGGWPTDKSLRTGVFNLEKIPCSNLCRIFCMGNGNVCVNYMFFRVKSKPKSQGSPTDPEECCPSSSSVVGCGGLLASSTTTTATHVCNGGCDRLCSARRSRHNHHHHHHHHHANGGRSYRRSSLCRSEPHLPLSVSLVLERVRESSVVLDGFFVGVEGEEWTVPVSRMCASFFSKIFDWETNPRMVVDGGLVGHQWPDMTWFWTVHVATLDGYEGKIYCWSWLMTLLVHGIGHVCVLAADLKAWAFFVTSVACKFVLSSFLCGSTHFMVVSWTIL